MPFAVAGVLGALLLRAPYLLLESLSGVVVVGVYAAGMRFIESSRMVPQAFFDALMPQLAAQNDKNSSQKMMYRDVLRVVIFGGFVALGATIFAELLVLWTYGRCRCQCRQKRWYRCWFWG